MRKRTQTSLHRMLLEIAEEHSAKVYYQPPANLKMIYPCIVYSVMDSDIRHADNSPYITNMRYQITVITKNQDTSIPYDILSKIPYTALRNSNVSDNLYHFFIYCYEII